MLFTMLFGIANVSHPTIFRDTLLCIANDFRSFLKYAIYQSSISYTIAAYGVYAASATGGNDFARDFLSGIAAIYSTPMYNRISTFHNSFEWASSLLGFASLLVVAPAYYFYYHGASIRQRSPFAQQIEELQKQRDYAHPAHES